MRHAEARANDYIKPTTRFTKAVPAAHGEGYVYVDPNTNETEAEEMRRLEAEEMAQSYSNETYRRP